jgi:hypothetical protein
LKKYLEKIENAQSLEELDALIEVAAHDETISNTEYCDIYSKALTKAQSI